MWDIAPGDGCDEARAGQELRVPYTAIYMFLKKARFWNMRAVEKAKSSPVRRRHRQGTARPWRSRRSRSSECAGRTILAETGARGDRTAWLGM
jgi:hypothetical protein